MVIEVGEEKGLFRKRDYVEVTSDVCDISKRVKGIDPGYFILFNKRKQRYELHHSGQPDFTFCLLIPYDTLDERLLNLIYDTRTEKLKEIVAKMEAHNEHLERKQDEYAKDYIKWVGSEVYNYVSTKAAKDTIDSGAFKTRFI